jgi:hypothetical protein
MVCGILQNSNLINKILAYSAKKIKAEPPAPYLILKPETNSDSPSAKSKGVLCGLAVRVPGYTTEMYCVSCEVRN